MIARITANRPLLIIIAIAILLRVAAALYLGNEVAELPGTADQISYHALATRVLEGHGFSFDRNWWPSTAAGEPTAHWSYLYTFYLTGVYALFGVQALAARLIQAALVGIVQTYLTYRLGRRLFGRRAGLWAAGLSAVYAYFIYYAAALMTEAFYFTAILASLVILVELGREPAGGEARDDLRGGLLLGISLGATVLLRQVFLLMVPILLLWLWWVRARAGGRRPFKATAITLGLLVLFIAPFTLFNAGRFDRFVLLNTNAGYAFYWANHPVYGTRFQPILDESQGNYRDLIPQELRRGQLDEAALDAELLSRGLGFVTDDPGRYALLSLSRIPAYFTFWPSSDSGLVSNLSRVGSFGLMLPLMVAGVVMALRRQPDPAVLLLIVFMVAYTAVHLLSWALIRYRLPVDAIWILFAGLAAAALAEKILVRGKTYEVFETS